MKAEYKRDMHSSYLIFQEPEGEENVYEAKMLANNQIPGFLNLEIRSIDNKQQYYFDITSKQPILLVFQKGQLNKEQILKMMGDILRAVESAKEYLLDENNLILDPEYIFINVSNMQVNLCCLPGYKRNINLQMRSLIEYIMDKVDYQKEDSVLLAYGLYQISRSENCTLSALKEVLEGRIEPYKEFQNETYQMKEMRKEEYGNRVNNWNDENQGPEDYQTEEEAVKEKTMKYPAKTWFLCIIIIAAALLAVIYAVKTGLLVNQIDGRLETVRAGAFLGVLGIVEFCGLNYLLDEKKKTAVKAHEKTEDVPDININIKNETGNDKVDAKGNSMHDFPARQPDKPFETNIYEEDERTVVLGSADWGGQYQLSAVNRDLYQDIPLIEFPFFVGKLKTKVDFIIPSQAISRFHAKFEKEGEQFYLMDLNSTNGTYLNGHRLNSNERKEICIGDQVGFADVIYILKKI